jgi:hypothetical protein
MSIGILQCDDVTTHPVLAIADKAARHFELFGRRDLLKIKIKISQPASRHCLVESAASNDFG